MLVDIAKILLSKDTREAFTTATRFMRSSPGWSHDLVQLEFRFGPSEDFKAKVFCDFVVHMMQEKTWPEPEIKLVDQVLVELRENAFTHGTKGGGYISIQISAKLSTWSLQCRVNDTGPGFDLQRVLTDPAHRDHALHTINELAHRRGGTLRQSDPNTIVFELDADAGKASFKTNMHGGKPYVLATLKGTFAYEAERMHRIFAGAAARQPPGAPLLIDLTEACSFKSAALRVLMLESRRQTSNSVRIAVLRPKDEILLETFEISRFDLVFPMFDTKDEALHFLFNP